MPDSTRGWMAWAPVAVLASGILGLSVIEPDRTLQVLEPLQGFPREVAGLQAASDTGLSEAELDVLRPDDYLWREYRGPGGYPVSLFVAFYGQQTGGSSIHSPRNCLPGSGWEPVLHDRIRTATAYGAGEVNRYLVEHESGARALVYYWYQGRGRVAANEYFVKFELMRDAVFRRRTDEALVRLVIPVSRQSAALRDADARASVLVREVIRELTRHLPA